MNDLTRLLLGAVLLSACGGALGTPGASDSGAADPDASGDASAASDAGATADCTVMPPAHVGPTHEPGTACGGSAACHAPGNSNGLVEFTISGTVYPALHEADNCVGYVAPPTAQVLITDKNGLVVTLSANASGNFFIRSASLVPPYQAKVVVAGKEKAAVGPQMSGDCNSCHTEQGANGAPGRIVMP